jgi:hypothetical protein
MSTEERVMTKIHVQQKLAGRCNRRRRLREREAANRRSVQIMRGVSAPQMYHLGKDERRLSSEMPCAPLTEKNKPTAVEKQNPRNSFVQNWRNQDVLRMLIVSLVQDRLSSSHKK